MITTPEIICDLFSFLDKDRIERIQLISQFWNNVIIRHKNILPLRKFTHIDFIGNQICLYETEEDYYTNNLAMIEFDGTNLNKIEEDVSSRYSQLTVDEVLTNLNDIVFDTILINDHEDEDFLDYLLNFLKLFTTKTGGRFRARYAECYGERFFGSKLVEIFDNYIIVDELTINCWDSCIREVCTNPEIVQLPSTPKEIRLGFLEFEENDKVLDFTCNGKLNGANRLTIEFRTSDTNYGNFVWQWFELYRKHQNPISLFGKFTLITPFDNKSALDAVKTLLNNTQLRVKYSLETKEFHSSFYENINQYVKRSCVLHETDSYALAIEMEYGEVTDMKYKCIRFGSTTM